LVFSLFSNRPTDEFLGFWWRVPFLLSAILVVIGLFIRMQIAEPPAFARVKETGTEAKMPIVDAITQHPKEVLVAMGARLAENGVFYIYTVFVLTYVAQVLGLPQSTVLT